MFQELIFTSQKIGVAPALTTAERQEIIVNEGKTTSSPSLKSIVLSATSKDVLPLDRATHYFLSKYRAQSSSNSCIIGLVPDILFLESAFKTENLSFIVRLGSKTFIILE